ncbi:ATP-dependent DNA helicase 2 subunit 1 [Porphyridium purpureum]|uniref:ATP-dependent DNA helicase 2 subunit 1 n=1 Tax=Porphyridium purpureum TaxID=35688 RepID=A0A5J4YWM6_PORPP|nr:ATP-dependent DNA helicase 2 subunit 1 [Porphyridium purpureum]|eukprot:POR2758..scf209_3
MERDVSDSASGLDSSAGDSTDSEAALFQSRRNVVSRNDRSVWISKQRGRYAEHAEPVHSSILFVVDMSGVGRKCQNIRDHQVKVALQCVAETLRKRVIEHEADLYGVLLYGTNEKGRQSDAFRNTHVLLELDKTTVQRILKVEHLATNLSQESEWLRPLRTGKQAFQHANFERVLNKCQLQKAPMGRESGRYNQHVVFFTDDDDPCRGSSRLIRACQSHASMLSAGRRSVRVHHFHDGNSKQTFDRDKFWTRVFSKHRLDESSIAQSEDETELLPALSFAEFNDSRGLLDGIRKLEMTKRTHSRFRFYVNDEVFVDLEAFCLLRKARRPAKKYIHWTTKQPVFKVLRWRSRDTARVVHESELMPAYRFANVLAPFTHAEVVRMETLVAEKCIKLMGFVSVEKVKLSYMITPPTFLTLAEHHARSSGEMFVCLLDSMLRKNKAAIVLSSRKQVQICALIPQAQTLDRLNRVSVAGGFHLIELPFRDGLKNNVETLQSFDSSLVRGALQSVSSSQSDHAGHRGVRQMTADLLSACADPGYDFLDESNPELQRFFEKLERKALGDDAPELEITDAIALAADEMEKACGTLLRRLGSELFGDDFNVDRALESERERKKRESAKREEQDRKRKREEVDANPKLRDAWENAEFESLTIGEIKELCRAFRLRLSGPKAELIDRLQEHRRSTERR